MIVNILFFLFFLLSSVWFAILTFSKSPIVRIMRSSTFFTMVILILVGHILSIFFSNEIVFQPWHIAVIVVSIVLYGIVLTIVRREYFIHGISEEEFGTYLIEFLDEQKYPYRQSEKSLLPDIEAGVPIKAFYIYLTKTAYIRVQSNSLLQSSKAFFLSRLRNQAHPTMSYERFLYGLVSFLLLLSAFRFVPYF